MDRCQIFFKEIHASSVYSQNSGIIRIRQKSRPRWRADRECMRGRAGLTRTPIRYSSPSAISPVYPYFRDRGKEAREGLRFPFFRAGTTQFRKNACRFPCVHNVNFTVFTSESARAPDRANMGQLGRQKSGQDGVQHVPARERALLDHPLRRRGDRVTVVHDNMEVKLFSPGVQKERRGDPNRRDYHFQADRGSGWLRGGCRRIWLLAGTECYSTRGSRIGGGCSRYPCAGS
jgi:hypothetical protein